MSDYEPRIQKAHTGGFKIPEEIRVKLEEGLRGAGAVQGTRFNKGKIRPQLFPVNVLEEVLKVLEMGAQKYGDYNWKKGLKYLSTTDSLERHVMDFKKGKDIDDESGLYNMAHVIANAAFILYFQLSGREDLDDRHQKP